MTKIGSASGDPGGTAAALVAAEAAARAADVDAEEAARVAAIAALPSTFAPVPTAWVAPTLTNSWTDYGNGFQTARYRKAGDMVELEGVIAGGATSSIAFTLPAGFRPLASALPSVLVAGGVGELIIATSGTVTVIELLGVCTTFTSLFGVRFSTV